MTDIFETENSLEVVDRNNGMPPAQNIVEAGGTLQQTRTSYNTAVTVQKPRDLGDVQRRLMAEANLAGETFYYGWGEGRNRIEGPSVKLATAAARCYGNCAVDLGAVQETRDSWIFTAFFIDLETGFTLPRQFRQSKKWNVYGKHDAERKEDIRFQIGQSKAVRNVLLNALPPALINQALDQAKACVRKKIEMYVEKNGMVAAVDLLTKELAKNGVKEDRLLAKVGKAESKGLTLDDIITLRGDLTALQNGEVTAAELFHDGTIGSDGKVPTPPPSGTVVAANGAPPAPPAPPKAEPKKAKAKKAPKENTPEPEPQGDTEDAPAVRITFDEALKRLTTDLRYSELESLGKLIEQQNWDDDKKETALVMVDHKIQSRQEEG